MNNFTISSAPLQGFTDHIWRNAHAKIFGGIDTYYSPFIRVEHGEIMKRDIRDVFPENNTGINFVPQILACAPDEMLIMVKKLKSFGYQRIDINLGCPFPPIALHQKGSGLLPYYDKLKVLLETLSKVEEIEYSVKMRLGWINEKEWEQVIPLMDIIKPTHITIHPRIGKQQYKGELNIKEFEKVLNSTTIPIIYNGGIKSNEDIEQIKTKYNVSGVMIGRGLVENPAMLLPEKATRQNFQAFHDTLFDAYSKQLSGGDHQILGKMKSLWEIYLPEANHKAKKAIKKSSNINKYEIAVEQLFSELEG